MSLSEDDGAVSNAAMDKEAWRRRREDYIYRLAVEKKKQGIPLSLEEEIIYRSRRRHK